MTAVIDNDILIKGACYGILQSLLSTLPSPEPIVGVLGAAQFVVPKRIAKKNPSRGVDAAITEFEEFLASCLTLEPTEGEQEAAAQIEFEAQRMGVSLDAGESQLCAIVALRAAPLLFTGDKRAIRSLESVIRSDSRLTALCKRIKCFEQLMRDLLSVTEVILLRSRVCAERHVDKTISICFACHSAEFDAAAINIGLNSYIADLRNDAPLVLHE